jgi:hypothetical protein
MSAPSNVRRALRRRFVRQLAVTSGAVASVIVFGAAAIPKTARLVYSTPQPLGNGTVRTYVTLDASNKPTSIGVALSEAALSGLPAEPKQGTPFGAMLTLPLPAQAKVSGLDHVELQWNPQGHEPEHVYTHPHFDFHFYSVTSKEVMAIMPDAPGFAEKAARVPDAKFAPAGYVAGHLLMKVSPAEATMPMMGLHWIDPKAGELNGQHFTATFIAGSYDGRFIFLEPMITKAFIESAKTAPSGVIALPVKQPTSFERPMYYPGQYSITWNAEANEYRVSLDGLVLKK